MKNLEIWQRAQAFAMEEEGQQGFSLRLASRNVWTHSFTAAAIEEYRRFMYLAAISERMVSPSHIVDLIWHEHLTFSRSYAAFCEQLGKKIHHEPSTHKRGDREKFAEASAYTFSLYEREFETAPPAAFWEREHMLDIFIDMPPAAWRLPPLWGGFLILLASAISAPFWAFDIYMSIQGAHFLWLFVLLVLFSLLILYHTALAALQNLLKKSSAKGGFLSFICPYEILVLQPANGRTQAAHCLINGLVGRGLLLIKPEKSKAQQELYPNPEAPTSADLIEQQALAIFEANKAAKRPLKMTYINYLSLLSPILFRAERLRDNIIKALGENSDWRRLWFWQWGVLALIYGFGIGRIIVGISRDKPVFFLILLVLVSLGLIAVTYWNLILKKFFMQILPASKRAELSDKEIRNDAGWAFLYKNYRVAALIPMIQYMKKIESGVGSKNSGSSGDASGCGGGGGDGGSCGGGGCGGCGG